MLASGDPVIGQHRVADCLVGRIILKKSSALVLQSEIPALGVRNRCWLRNLVYTWRGDR